MPAWERPDAWALGNFRNAAGKPLTGLVLDDVAFDVQALLDRAGVGRSEAPTIRSLLESWDESFERLSAIASEIRQAGVADPRWESLRSSLSTLKVLAPVQPPERMFQAGANYRKHVIDLLVAQRVGASTDLDEQEFRREVTARVDERIDKDVPFVFIGLSSSICGPYDDVVLPYHLGKEHDWELELTAVIGRSGRSIARADAMSHIAGYTICNDLTVRDRIYRPDLLGVTVDWLVAKNAPTFTPTGPFLVPAAFVPDPLDVQIVLRVNGQVMQNESTSDMLFPLDRLIEHASAVTDLVPGDLLLTGSPAGNGSHWKRFLGPGDVIDAEITGLGTQRNVCVVEGSSGQG